MAKKKTTTVTEEVEETPIDYEKDIKDKSFDQVSELPKETKEETEEEVKETEEGIPAFDPETFKKVTAEQIKQEIMESLKGENKEETKENISHYEEFQKDFLSKNNRQPTWFEVAEDMEQQAVLKLEAKQAEKTKEQEEAQTQQKQAETKQTEETNKYVKDTLDELYTNEKLPKIQDKKDKDDYGLRVQNSLLSKVVEVNGKRIADGVPPKTIKEVFYEDFEMPAKDVAGANAPVNMGRGGYTPDETQELDYSKDIAGPRNSIRNILTRATKRG